MGQGGSGGGKAPGCVVPTTSQLRRAKVESQWWSLQADGKVPAPVALQTYGRPYAALLEQHCGKHRQEHQRCIRSRKLDPLNMQKWYPHCGETYELEGACSMVLVSEIDKRCRTQLDKAAGRLSGKKVDFEDSSVKASLGAVGDCVTKLAQAKKAFTVEYDAAAAHQRFLASKRLMERD
mmetsp:Transcript_105671/g.297230  ORF Transcript_105671/g.297230 Transcript_105671/m.297230 type:complete len:179 (+) Transcript_105671:115-651(+)